MTVYGTKIKSDIDFPLDLTQETETRHEVELLSKVPKRLKDAMTCGFYFQGVHGRKSYLYSDREFDGSETGQPWCYEVEDVLKFYWVGGEQAIYYELGEKGDANLLSFWFIHLFLPLYMTLENRYDFLHTAAVEVEGKLICFLAPAKGGKSTMMDYFIKQGHTLFTDDRVPTFIKEGKFMAVGSHPYYRPYRKFEELGYRVEKFTSSFKPIHAFYALKGVEGDADITIEEIKGAVKIDTLLLRYLFGFPWLRVERFKYLSKMLNTIRVFQVCVPWDIDRLGEVHTMICEHCKEME